MSRIDPTIHELIHELAQVSYNEPRHRARRPFGVRQWIAQWSGSGIPDASAFLEVRCYNISERGFSFLFPTRPEFQSLVAALGQPPALIYLAAEVVHCTRAVVLPSGTVKRLPAGASGSEPPWNDPADAGARPMVLVGCRFLERLYPTETCE